MTIPDCEFVIRIVPSGKPCNGEVVECDMEAPCDLVVMEIKDGSASREELDRRPFRTGHAASAYLCRCLGGDRNDAD